MADKKTKEEIDSMFEAARAKITVNNDYHHYKGARYRVLDFAWREDSQVVVVIYEALYEPFLGVRFTRPAEEFLETVDLKGEKTKRFMKITD